MSATRCCYGHEAYFSGCEDCPYVFPANNREPLDAAHDALDRMRRAAEHGTGCHLTADMIQALAVSLIGQMWEEARPT